LVGVKDALEMVEVVDVRNTFGLRWVGSGLDFIELGIRVVAFGEDPMCDIDATEK